MVSGEVTLVQQAAAISELAVNQGGRWSASVSVAVYLGQ